MSRIYVIAEDISGFKTLKKMLELNFPKVNVEYLAIAGSISQLADTIEGAMNAKDEQQIDCIVILYDQDPQETRRSHHENVQNVCKKYPQIILIEAQSETESWILADDRFCKWVSKGKGKNRDSIPDAKEEKNRWIDAKFKKKSRAKLQYLDHIDGSGIRNSGSGQRAITQLKKNGCLA